MKEKKENTHTRLVKLEADHAPRMAKLQAVRNKKNIVDEHIKKKV